MVEGEFNYNISNHSKILIFLSAFLLHASIRGIFMYREVLDWNALVFNLNAWSIIASPSSLIFALICVFSFSFQKPNKIKYIYLGVSYLVYRILLFAYTGLLSYDGGGHLSGSQISVINWMLLFEVAIILFLSLFYFLIKKNNKFNIVFYITILASILAIFLLGGIHSSYLSAEETLHIAIETNNSDLCNNLPTIQEREFFKSKGSIRDACFHVLAKKLNRPDYCKSIEDSSNKNICLDNQSHVYYQGRFYT